jgi:carbon monoxide dehydrogenase subunit G
MSDSQAEMLVSRSVKAPAERLWQLIADLDRLADVVSGIGSIERLDPGEGFDVGATWREVRLTLGGEGSEVIRVTEIDPGRRYTSEAEGRHAHFTWVWTVEPQGEGSLLTVVLRSKPKGVLARLITSTVGRLYRGVVRRGIERDLDDIARWLEGTGADTGKG